ncbi:MAG: response regulator [Prevotella sp.]|jgi:ligand-binding sensor domain-containing protein/signal transduction histidine kinase/AraC-like DNA-binding protein|nr:response regulator [Prevotella sp.]
MKSFSFLFFVILLLTSVFIKAEDIENYYFRHYTNKDGLSHNTVFCSLQDKKGFMWFGTASGLNRFDGHSFTIYRYNSWSPDNKGLPNDYIFSLFEDSSGKIWICTDGGTCYYDYETDMFYPLIFPESKEIERFSYVNEDPQKNLWFCDYNRIIKYTPNIDKVKVYRSEDYGFHAHTMTMAGEGYPIFADGASIYMYRDETDKFAKTSVITETEREDNISIHSVYQVSSNHVLIGTNKGLKMYNLYDGTIETIIQDVYVRSMMVYNTHTCYIATESGLYIYDLMNNTYSNLKKSLINEYSISDNAVYSITQDREGGIWIGSFFGGINYLPKNYTDFTYFIGGKTHPNMLGNTIREICSDKYGNLWMGTEDNGVNCYNLKNNSIVNYSLNNPVRKLSATNIHGLYADGDTLWIGTFNRGIDLLDIPTGKLIKNYSQTNTTDGLVNDFVLCFQKTRQEEFLIGTNAGVLIYNKEMDNFSRWKDIRYSVRQIYEDIKGRIWITTTNGLFKYTPPQINKNERLVYYGASEAYKGLGGNNITSVMEDSKGRIWVTSTSGISLYDEPLDSFTRITVEDGLPTNLVFRIEEGDDNNLWISTANGLVKFNPETNAMYVYNYANGLRETQFNYSSSFKAKNGTIYMGTIDGMISFNPKYFKHDTYIPPLYISNVNVPEFKEDVIKNSYNSVSDLLELPYHVSSFTVSYIAPAYTSPDAIEYSYMLEGVDKNWIDVGSHKEVTFAGLSPGKYTFRVRSTNSSGEWQQNEKAIQIIITPPLWQTPWAYFVYVMLLLFFLLIIYLYYKTKMEKVHRRRQELFEVEKEKEIYNAKIQFFTFITHEIRTPLTLIKAPLEKIIHSDDGTPSTKKNLHIIEKNTQRLLDLSNQLLDFRKVEIRGFRLNYVKTDIVMWTNSIIQPFLGTFEKERKQFTYTSEKECLIAYIDREAYAKILSNLLTNALKYSESAINLDIRLISEEEDCFCLSISNDGTLIPESEKDAIFTPFYRLKGTEGIRGSGIGLSLSRSLAEFHQGTLVYNQTDNELNQFILTIPVQQDDYCFGNNPESIDAQGEQVDKQITKNDETVILIVEDQADMRKYIAEELSGICYILEAENGEKALSILENNQVNMIISDVMMPVMDGYELCNKVKNDVRFSHIPFILLTAQHNLQSRLEGLNQGADAYMEKPFSLEHLIAQINSLLRNRELIHKAYQERPAISVSSLALSPMDDIFLQKLNIYIEDNITNEDLNVEMIANEMGMSNSSLYRKLKGLSGLSPVDFIKSIRLRKAVDLMYKGERRISQIAFETGFSSPAYFSTSFQKQFGKTPTEYIREQRLK